MGWIRCKCDAHKKQVGVKQLYNPVPRRVGVSWGQLQLKFELQFEAVRTSSQQWAWALRTPSWAAQQNEKRSASIVRGTGGQYVAVCSVSNSPLTQNPFAPLLQPFWIKCERYIFLKKCVCSSLLLIMFPHVYVYVCCITAIQHRDQCFLLSVPGYVAKNWFQQVYL